MLIDLKEAIKNHDLRIRGIVHVGAHYGQEYEAYYSNGIKDIVFIEPCDAAYKVLEGRVGKDPKVLLFKCACGEVEGSGEMNVETRNQGQSNSLLKPKKHLDYYPEIQFNSTETVPIRKLDNLPFDPTRYNLLMMDTQGGELSVVKGASHTLKHIDYIYTEVNNQELYEGNAMVSDLDSFLVDFKRVESHWVGAQGWGDAIYIRTSLLNGPDATKKYL